MVELTYSTWIPGTRVVVALSYTCTYQLCNRCRVFQYCLPTGKLKSKQNHLETPFVAAVALLQQSSMLDDLRLVFVVVSDYALEPEPCLVSRDVGAMASSIAIAKNGEG